MGRADRIRRLKEKKAGSVDRQPAHYPLAPSSMTRILNCPGSLTIGPEKPGRSPLWSREGSEKHRELESHLRRGTWPKDTDLQTFVGYVNGLKQECDVIQEGIEEKILHPRIPDFGGTVDYWLHGKDEKGELLFIVDFKYGVGVEVSSEKNDQLTSYIKLVFDTKDIPFYADLYGTIVQPRSTSNPKPRESRYYLSDLDRLETELGRVAKRSHEFNAGSWCQFCPAKMYLDAEGAVKACPKHEAMVTQVGGVPLPQNYQELLRAETYVKSYYERLRWTIQEKLRTGETVAGFGLSIARSNRSWIDEDKTKRALSGMGLPATAYEETKVKSPAQVESFIKANLGSDPDLSHLTRRRIKGYQVVDESKSTIEFTTAETDFKGVKNERKA